MVSIPIHPPSPFILQHRQHHQYRSPPGETYTIPTDHPGHNCGLGRKRGGGVEDANENENLHLHSNQTGTFADSDSVGRKGGFLRRCGCPCSCGCGCGVSTLSNPITAIGDRRGGRAGGGDDICASMRGDADVDVLDQ